MFSTAKDHQSLSRTLLSLSLEQLSRLLGSELVHLRRQDAAKHGREMHREAAVELQS